MQRGRDLCLCSREGVVKCGWTDGGDRHWLRVAVQGELSAWKKLKGHCQVVFDWPDVEERVRFGLGRSKLRERTVPSPYRCRCRIITVSGRCVAVFSGPWFTDSLGRELQLQRIVLWLGTCSLGGWLPF